MTSPHDPVLIEAVMAALAPSPGRRIIDATFGAGGYARRILASGASLLALDRDPLAAVFAAPLSAAHPDAFVLCEARFSDLEAVASRTPLPGAAAGWDGVVFDLGVSSMQLDAAERGFSFMRDGPLDMRMGPSGPCAADLVNESEEAELARIIWLYGEERASRRIAAAIVRRRAREPFRRTLDLAKVVETALGGRRGQPTHPATRTFQALRIAVNDELGELSRGLEAAEHVLAEGGRLAVVTFHSLEDRIVKSFLAERAGRVPAPSRHLPQAAGGPRPTFALQFGGVQAASPAETLRNPRARSAKLRAGVRTDAPAWRRAA